jgi:hypothetical protein
MSLGYPQYGADPFEKRYAEIMQMKDGAAKNEAMRQLFQDYPGRMSAATDQVDKGFKMATMQPAGMTEGNRANPFAVDVGAGLLQHVGNAGMAYKGGQQMKQGRATMEQMSADQEAANMAMANAALQKAQSGVLRGMRTPEEEEEWMRAFGRR